MKTGHIIIGSVVGAGLIWAGSRLWNKKKVGDTLDTKINVKVHSIDLKGLTLRLDVTLINPTEGTLTIKQPYIKVLFNKKEVGTTQLEATKIVIEAYQPKLLQPIYLTIPATGLFTLGDGLVKVLLKGQTAQITTKIRTSIYLGVGFKNVEITSTQNLKR
jgi:hypothetical protein